MSEVNIVIKSGNIGHDPELKDAGSSKVCNFSLAQDNGYMKDNAWQEKLEWYDCEVWNGYAEAFVNKCKKGDRIHIVGKTKINEYEKEGEKRYKHVIVINEFKILHKSAVKPENA